MDTLGTTPEAELSPEREAELLQDILLFREKFAANNCAGRPRFEGKVQAGDQQAVTHWLTWLTDRVGSANLFDLWVTFNYLSDLDTTQERGGGYSGLIGPDPGAIALRRGLVGRLLTMPNYASVQHDRSITEAGYLQLFDQWFTRTVGVAAYAEFTTRHGDNGNMYPVSNPYLAMDPQQKVDLMYAEVQKLAVELGVTQ